MKAIVYTRYGSPDVLQFKDVVKTSVILELSKGVRSSGKVGTKMGNSVLILGSQRARFWI